MEKFTRRQILGGAMGLAVNTAFSRRVHAQEQTTADLQLQSYLAEIEPELTRACQIVAEHDIYDGLKTGFTADDRVEDINRYGPLYIAGERQFKIDRRLLQIIHLCESEVSRFGDPERWGFVGPMQRSPDLYPASQVAESLVGVEYLAGLTPQLRYGQADLEIIWAAYHLRQLVDPIKDQFRSDLRAQRYAVGELYSNPRFGWLRVEWFDHISKFYY